MDNKEKFIEIFKSKIHREGSTGFLKWLEKTDFFTAPASTKYHGAKEGGLCEHSLNVYAMLREEVINTSKLLSGSDKLGESEEEKIAICSLLHDICKVNFYKTDYRNQKNSATGEWEKVPYYTIDNKFAYGHGEKSVWLIEKFMKLNVEESIAIRWHMGAFDDAVKGGCFDLNTAWGSYPFGALLHIADLKATYLLDS